jgi:adenylate cyclase
MDTLGSSDVFVFDRFRLHRRGAGLFRQDAAGAWVLVDIGARALDVLGVLVDRHGDLVTRDELMRAVWPGMAIEEHNLTVQISALRRVLDEGRTGSSCIVTVPGRGYRFVLPVTRPKQAHADPALAPARLSIVVLPFENLSGDPKDGHLADAITDDLTSDLTLIPDVSVTAREAANAYHGQSQDVRTIGEELRVRYVLKGSVRRLGTTLRVNIRLISAETSALLWSDRFEQEIGEPGAAQDSIVTRLKDELDFRLIDIESTRSIRERPNNPDAFDLALHARSIIYQPPSLQRQSEVLRLLESALALDPRSVYAMTYIAFHLTSGTEAGGGAFRRQNSDDMQRAGHLLAQARAIAPDSLMVLNTYVMWLREVGRCAEAIEVCQRAIHMYPNRIRGFTNFHHVLAGCKTWMGHAEEGIALEAEADRLNPRSPWRFNRYRYIGWYSLLLGRDLDAINYLQRSLAIKPEEDGSTHWQYRWLAGAYARTGNVASARQYLASAERLWPYDTVRSRAPELLTSPVYVEQFRRFQDALRLTGLRDHADEDADFGVPADAALHGELAGLTPTCAPGAKTLRTVDFVQFLAESRPIVIDMMTYFWGQSIPGAVGLKYAGLGGSITDAAQGRLRGKMHELTKGNFDAPIVAIGWNSERFDGRNLVLRLVALGYTNVYWYRGGREAWETNDLPEDALDVQDW